MARRHFLVWSTKTCIWSHLLTAVLLLLGCCLRLAVSASTVEFLPGFPGPLPFELETGYVGVGESEDVQLFYYFVKSERNPEKDPLLLWLSGGPGCSGWSGLVYEIGPVNFKIEPYNGSLPTLLPNQYSWTKVSNIIFVDCPVGTGFSYSKTSSASDIGDSEQVRDLVHFIKKWLIDHSEFISNPVYIGGDSYSGMIVPILVQQIFYGIEEGILPPINLKEYILGNPSTDPSDSNYKIPFAYGMALISDELYKSLETSCSGEYQNIDPNNIKCLKDMQAYTKCISRIAGANILEAACSSDYSPKPQDSLTSGRRSLYQNSDQSALPPFGCRTYNWLLAQFWANDPDVREALHVRKGSIGVWQRCNEEMTNRYQYDVLSAVPYHANLSAKGHYRSLIYSGDHDFVVPFLATQAWIRSLNYSIIDDWRPWFVETQVAGYTRTYSNRMTYATVKGAGHTAPEYNPKECYAMFKRWIHYEPL